MSGTPVINTLQEGKSLVEMITGHRHDDLDVEATVQNCMRLYQRLEQTLRDDLALTPRTDVADLARSLQTPTSQRRK